MNLVIDLDYYAGGMLLPGRSFNSSNYRFGYNKSQGKNRNDTKIQHFKINECKNCPVITLCTKSKYGRVLERSEYAEYIEQNRKNMEANPTFTSDDKP